MFSVCIPVYNEEENIQRIANNVRKSKLWMESKEKELIFCINGSNDRSEVRARVVAARDPNVKVIVLQQKGKNHAWEALVEESSPKSEFLFFADADVAVNPDTFSKLESELKRDQKLAIAGARIVPIKERKWYSIHRRYYEKLLNHNHFEGRIPVLVGRCYAIRRSEAKTVKLPRDQRIYEDTFLEMTFHGRVKIVAGAKVYFRIPSYFDFIRQLRRDKISEHVFMEKYPELARRHEEITGKGPLKVPENLTVGERYGVEAHIYAKKAAKIAAWIALRSKKDHWGKLKSARRGLKK